MGKPAAIETEAATATALIAVPTMVRKPLADRAASDPIPT
jgi:hypothetical protein